MTASDDLALYDAVGAAALEVMAFLGRRHQHKRARHSSCWIGLSSDALVWHAITGDPPTERPHDAADFARCLVTRALAPVALHARMDVQLADWSALLESERPGTVADAAKARDEWLPWLREEIS